MESLVSHFSQGMHIANRVIDIFLSIALVNYNYNEILSTEWFGCP